MPLPHHIFSADFRLRMVRSGTGRRSVGIRWTTIGGVALLALIGWHVSYLSHALFVASHGSFGLRRRRAHPAVGSTDDRLPASTICSGLAVWLQRRCVAHVGGCWSWAASRTWPHCCRGRSADADLPDDAAWPSFAFNVNGLVLVAARAVRLSWQAMKPQPDRGRESPARRS